MAAVAGLRVQGFSPDEIVFGVLKTIYRHLKNSTRNFASSVKKKWKDKGFARAVNRDVIERGSELMGEPLEVLIERTIEALKPVERELGLGVQE